MLFKTHKKLTVLQALLLAAAFAMVIAACSENTIGGISGTNQTPTADDYNVGTNLIQTAGSVTAVTVTKKDNTKSPGAVTVKYNGTATLPQTDGSYTITFDVAEAPGWDPATGLDTGKTLVVNELLTPALTDYNISENLEQTVGSTSAVTVTKKDNSKSPGAVTVYYTGTGDTTYAKNTVPPTVAGTYAVTFDVVAASGWNQATGLSAGTLIIENPPRNYASGDDALAWGVSTQASVLTLGLTPGKDTTEINLNWYSSGTVADKVAKVRFIRGTLAHGTELIEQDGEGAVSAASSGYTAHKATVKGLKPGSSYQYAVSSDGTNWSDAYDFKVPPATGAFKFAVIADPQLHNTTWDVNNRYTPDTTGSKTAKGWLDTMAKIVEKGVSFIASGGDQVDTGSGGTFNESEYTFFFTPPGLRNLPFAPVAGNHDSHLQWSYHYNVPNKQTFNGETDQYEAGKNYFYLYNNILFVVLNTAPYPVNYNAANASSTAAQPHVERFAQTLTAAKEVYAGKYDWLIVQHHKSTASVADHLADKDIESYVLAGFEKVMSDNNVDFVLAGHDHVYARSYPLDGRDGGKVSVPDKVSGADLTIGTKTYTKANYTTSPGKPIYLTFTTGSGLKYYAVSSDPTFKYNDTLYVKNNATYPYLGEVTNANGDASTQFGSIPYMTGVNGVKYLPVSNAAFVQPYIPSYTIAEVDGKTIRFSTYAIVTASGTSTGASASYSFDADVPYDVLQVTKD